MQKLPQNNGTRRAQGSSTRIIFFSCTGQALTDIYIHIRPWFLFPKRHAGQKNRLHETGIKKFISRAKVFNSFGFYYLFSSKDVEIATKKREIRLKIESGNQDNNMSREPQTVRYKSLVTLLLFFLSLLLFLPLGVIDFCFGVPFCRICLCVLWFLSLLLGTCTSKPAPRMQQRQRLSCFERRPAARSG